MLFFHVGLHKTGTTFLQQAVFPLWRGIEYITWPNLELFLRMDSDKTYFVSREGLSGQNWAHHNARDSALRRLSELFPDAKILISFRKHSGYIVSSYRQYLQRGGPLDFRGYFDIASDRGFMKKEDFLFRKKIESIERSFQHTPFVFLHSEISTNLDDLLLAIQSYVGGKAPSADEIPNKRFNAGVGYYPAILLRWLNAKSVSQFNPDGKYDLNNKILARFRLTPRHICRNWLSFLPKRRFLSADEVDEIDAYYKDDWQFVSKYAETRREFAGRPIPSRSGPVDD